MSEPTGLRARKKARTREAIGDAAVSLFLERGFDRVSVNDIAAAAEISKPTLFRYFPTKEDLVLHRFADHLGETARVVRACRSGLKPVTALHRHFRAGPRPVRPRHRAQRSPRGGGVPSAGVHHTEPGGTAHAVPTRGRGGTGGRPRRRHPSTPASRPGKRGPTGARPDQLAEDRRRSNRPRCPPRGCSRRRPGIQPTAVTGDAPVKEAPLPGRRLATGPDRPLPRRLAVTARRRQVAGMVAIR